MLIPTTIGPPAALWTAREPVMLADDLGALAVTPTRVDDAIPVSGRRFAHYAGLRVTLPSGAPATLALGLRITGGSVVFEGSSLALVVEHIKGRDLVVVALASGRLLQSVSVPPGALRLAARRGLAVVHDAPRRLALFDLRFARHLGSVVTDDDVSDVTIDPDGERLAIRLTSGELELAPIGARTTATRLSIYLEDGDDRDLQADSPDAGDPAMRTPPSPPAVVTAWPSPPTPSGRGALLVTPSRELPPAVVDALEPRPHRARLSRADALVELDREVRLVTLWGLRAISGAWDTRRLGYGNEGAHPYEHEVAALVGNNAGFAPDHIAAACEILSEHEARLATDPAYRGPSTPVGELAFEFGLSPAAVDILLVIAAPSLHGDVARLYGILANDTSRAMVDELLVQHVLAGRLSAYDITAELLPRAPLVRFGLLEVDPVILSRLRGEPPELGAACAPRPADRDLDALEASPGAIAAAIDAVARAARPARIAVRGRTGAGRRTLLAALADHAGRALGVIDATLLPRDADRFVDALRVALRRAQLAGLVPVVHRLDAAIFDHRSGSDVARDVLAAHPGPVAILAPPGAPPPLPLGHTAIDLPPLTETERLAVWQRALDDTHHWLRDSAGVAARYRIGPGVIHRAVAAAAAAATAATTATRDPAAPCDDRIDAFLRQARDLRLGDHARRVDRLATWADLVLPPDIMDSLRELIGRVRHRRTVFEDWGMSRAMATSRGLTALFQGQPGTGKTLVAGVIARELGLDLYQVDLSKVMSKWIGETERNLATIFDAAEDGQAILLFDEADALFAKRTEVRSSNDRYANLEVNYLLQRLDAFEGIAILTTNSGGSIDPAFKRRLSFQLSFPFPDEDTRAELWRAHLPRELPRAGELTFDALARKYQLSGGYIRNACLRAAFLAAQEETPLHQRHLERAVALEFAELGKLSTAGSIA
ncbi:MAG: ATP-binding protein [Deltaproteobacteria bacterium]|nr:MAG: ATP-binding protein [Deltaproteobacteria bacterium]